MTFVRGPVPLRHRSRTYDATARPTIFEGVSARCAPTFEPNIMGDPPALPGRQ